MIADSPRGAVTLPSPGAVRGLRPIPTTGQSAPNASLSKTNPKGTPS
jgi:hypothetical protein